jgi:hypothetical protein
MRETALFNLFNFNSILEQKRIFSFVLSKFRRSHTNS